MKAISTTKKIISILEYEEISIERNEFSFLDQKDFEIPLFNTTEIHAEAAVEFSLKDEDRSLGLGAGER